MPLQGHLDSTRNCQSPPQRHRSQEEEEEKWWSALFVNRGLLAASEGSRALLLLVGSLVARLRVAGTESISCKESEMGKPKTIVPRNSTDRMLFALMVVGIPFGVAWLGGVIMPHYHHTVDSTVVMHITCAIFIVYNIFHNMLLVIRVDASGRTSYLPSVLKPGWRYCAICQVNYPPRSYHCHTCDECILKRDHHCRFTGCCIGYHNHRYFLVGVLYIFLGALYGICYQWDYVYNTIDLPAVYFFMTLVAPHFALLLGAINLWGVVVAVLHTIGLCTLFMTAYLLAMQVRAICCGQTQYEMKCNINDYNLSLKQNIVDVLGKQWKLAWLSPFIRSPLRGDGIVFRKANEYEPPKDI